MSTESTVLFVGVPVKLGREGVRQIIELSLTAEESAALKKSAAAVQDLVDAMARLGAESARRERKTAGSSQRARTDYAAD